MIVTTLIRRAAAPVFLMLALLAVLIVSGYGFVVWMLQAWELI